MDYAKVKSRKFASDDDAENLLAGILDDTEDVARAEQERIEAELRAKADAERRRKEESERAKREENAARLSAEMDRLEKVQQRRTEKLQALKIEELKERGEWIDPEEERRKLEEKLQREAEIEAMKNAAEEKARAKAQAELGTTGAPVAGVAAAQQQKSPVGMIVAGIAVALVAVVAIAAVAMKGGYEVDQSIYSKAIFAPKSQTVAQVEKGFTPIPKPEPVVEEAPAAVASRPATRRTTTTRSAPAKTAKKAAPITSKPKQSDANKRAAELEKALSTDLFGGAF